MAPRPSPKSAPRLLITGETTGSLLAALNGPLADALAGMPLAEHTLLFERLASAMKGNTTAKCALDVAIHRALARPVGGLPSWLGGRRAPVRTDVTLSLSTPEDMGRAAGRRTEEGFDVLKLKVGGTNVETDVARVLTVAEAAPGATLRLDANQGWTPKHALAVLDRLDEEGVAIELLEQPVPSQDLVGLATISRNSLVPVLADESVHSATDVLRLAEAGAADMVNVKLAKCGGLYAARQVVATARACGYEVLIGTMLEPPSAVAAALALASTLPEGRAHDLDAGLWTADPGPLLYAGSKVTFG